MRPVSFIEPIRYDPLLLISEPDLSGRLKEMSWLERCAFAELMSGNLKTHVFYAVAQQRQAVSIAQPTDEGLVPRLIDMEGAAAAASSVKVSRAIFRTNPAYAGPRPSNPLKYC